MIEPKIDDLLAAVDSKYTLVILAAQARPRDQLVLQPARRGPRRSSSRRSSRRACATSRCRSPSRRSPRARSTSSGPRRSSRSTDVARRPPGPARCHGRHRRVQGRVPRPAPGRAGAEVTADPHAVGATRFVGADTFAALTGRRAYTSLWERPARSCTSGSRTRPTSPSSRRATANVLAKLAHGLADDLLTSTLLEYDRPARAGARDAHGHVGAPRDARQRRDPPRARCRVRRSGRGSARARRRGDGPASPSPRTSSAAVDARRGPARSRRAARAGHRRPDARADRPRPVHREPVERAGWASASPREAHRRGADVTAGARAGHGPAAAGVEVVHVETAEEMRDAVVAVAEDADAS